jgi:flagellar biogenesis protein FliO
MQSALPLSIVIAVAAFVFVAAYLLAQFITDRSHGRSQR